MRKVGLLFMSSAWVGLLACRLYGECHFGSLRSIITFSKDLLQRKYVQGVRGQIKYFPEVFIADLIACSTCFGHHYAHHQELKSIIQRLLPIHIILQSSACFEHCYAHLQEVQLYMYSIWYRHCLWVAVWSLTDSDGTRCCTFTIEPPEDERNNARNM